MGLRVEEFKIGTAIVTGGRTVGEGDIATFAGLVADFTPIHVDESYAAKTQFGGRIAHGPLAMSMAIGMLTQTNLLGDSVLALLNLNWDFKGAVKIGDTVHARVTPSESRLTKKPGAGVVKFAFEVINQHDETVQTGVMTVLMKTKEFDTLNK